ncbi:hypothetical protein, partial [Melaminivora alkalimesophila]|uniref:hypothetical protein n=1 Tax=Melaminivora alkalimesophila TaxID=1165852 RepID=UPI0019D3A95B
MPAARGFRAGQAGALRDAQVEWPVSPQFGPWSRRGVSGFTPLLDTARPAALAGAQRGPARMATNFLTKIFGSRN